MHKVPLSHIFSNFLFQSSLYFLFICSEIPPLSHPQQLPDTLIQSLSLSQYFNSSSLIPNTYSVLISKVLNKENIRRTIKINNKPISVDFFILYSKYRFTYSFFFF